MKTNRSARRVLRIRALTCYLGIAALATLEFWAAGHWQRDFAASSAPQTYAQPDWNSKVSVSDLFATR